MTLSLPTTIGRTENALRAVLTKTLSTTTIPTYEAWVVLNTASKAGTNGWRSSAADSLKADPHVVDGVVGGLRAAGLLTDDDIPTELGSAELVTARAAVAAATSQLVAGISEHEQAIAARVLDHLRDRAEAALGE